MKTHIFYYEMSKTEKFKSIFYYQIDEIKNLINLIIFLN